MASREMLAIVGISGVVDKGMQKAVDEAKKRISGINPTAVKVAATVAGIGVAGFKVGKELATLGDEYNKSMNQLQASTGVSKAELEGLGKVVKDVYGNNFGESIADVANGVADVKKQTGLMGPELQKVTEGAYSLQDTFEYDLTESARAAKAMMINFGTDGEKAMSMIAAGAQNGLDFSGELLDSISEYSVQFAKVGFSADDMFNIFQQGADSGAWNLDKVGDAIKEFSIRSIDGSKTTIEAYENIGLNADEMMQKFAKGGPTAKKAFSEVTDALLSIEDPVQRDAAGVGLFGTMWEDLGVDAVKAMSEIQNGTYDTEGALKNIQDVKFNDLGSAMEAIQRKVEVGLLPAASWLAKKIYELAPVVSSTIDTVMPYFQQLGDVFGPILTAVGKLSMEGFKFLGDNMNIILPIIGGLTGAFMLYKGTMAAATLATKAMNIQTTIAAAKTTFLTSVTTIWTAVSKAATFITKGLGLAFRFMTGPIGWVITAIGLVIAAGIALYKNWDTVKAYAVAFAGKVKSIFSGLKNSVVGIFGKMKDGIAKVFGMLTGVIKAPMNAVISLINKAIGKINGISVEIPDWVPGGGGTLGFNIPTIPMLATGGLTDGVSIAGEGKYNEWVITPDPRYRSDNLSYWAQAGRALGADASDYSISGTSSGDTIIDLGGVEFSPNIIVKGNANKDDIVAAIEEAYPEFMDMLEKLLSRKGAYSFEH